MPFALEDSAALENCTELKNLTVLVTVYHKVDPQHLDQSLSSLWTQTRPAAHVVLVEDGTLGQSLESVVSRHEAAHSNLKVVRNTENQGSGLASKSGMAHVHTEWVARLDADDIACNDRFEKQMGILCQRESEGNPIDVLGTALAEFEGSAENIIRVRRLPQTHAELTAYAKINSPINNPSVMMRVAAIEKAGGYRDVHLMEDYDLYARLIASGARLENMPEPLTLFRSDGMFQRRTSKGIIRGELDMQRTLIGLGLVSGPRAAVNFLARMSFRLLPGQLMSRIYRRLFSRPDK